MTSEETPEVTYAKPKIVLPVVIIVVVLLAVIGIGYAYWQTPKVGQLSTTPHEQPSGVSSVASLYYYTDPDDERKDISIYRMSTDLSQPDELIMQLSRQTEILGPYARDHEFLVKHDNKLQVLDMSTQQVNDLLTIPTDWSLTNARISHDKKFVAYALHNGDESHGLGQLWIYDLANQTTKQLTQVTLGLYQVPQVVGWDPTNTQVVLQVAGGDGGFIYGELSLVDTIKPNTQRAIKTPEEVTQSFMRGQMSPDGKYWLYTHCSKPEENNEVDGGLTCPAGEELFVYDFTTDKYQSIYQNTTNQDNESRTKLRVIFSALWQDPNTIVFSIPDGVYQMSLTSRIPQQLYDLHWIYPDEIHNNGVSITNTYPPYLVLQRTNLFAGVFVLDTKTKKVLEVGQNLPTGYVVPVTEIGGFL